MIVSIARHSIAGMLQWTQHIMFALALLTLGYCGFVFADSWIFQHRANLELEGMVRKARSQGMQFQSPERVVSGVLIGRIEVDRLGVSVAMVEGTDEAELNRAAGHITGTPFPGESGNVGIAAHRDTFFRPLRNIRENDRIRVLTPAGEYYYRVTSIKVVDPNDVSVLDSGGKQVLTLVTCYPFYYVGSAPKRFIVRAERISGTIAALRSGLLQPGT